MLEVMTGSTLCGVIYYNEIFEDIYADEYGILAFESTLDGGCYEISPESSSPREIHEMIVLEPLAVNTRLAAECVLNGTFGDCIGVIYKSTGDVIVLLDDSRAVVRSLTDPKVDTCEPFDYTTDCDYEVMEEE